MHHPSHPVRPSSTSATVAVLVAAAAATGSVAAGPIPDRDTLDALLSGSEEYLEDFEHVSFHSGSVMELPNPFNHETGAPLWADLLPGVTYTSTGYLRMYAGFLHGDDSNILQGEGDLTMSFDEPQVAVGFDLDGSSYILHQRIAFMHGTQEVGLIEYDMGQGATDFVGWTHPTGVTEIRIESTRVGGAAATEVDNIGWGIAAPPACAADLDGDGAVDLDDLISVLAAWNGCDGGCPQDLDGDEQVGLGDLLVVLASWGPCV